MVALAFFAGFVVALSYFRFANTARTKAQASPAAETHVDVSIKNPQLFLETNVMGTHNVAAASLAVCAAARVD